MDATISLCVLIVLPASFCQCFSHFATVLMFRGVRGILGV